MRRTFSQAQVDKINRTERVAGDQSNLLILFELTKFGEKPFNELKRMTGINAVTLTRKLRFLREEGLVEGRQAGMLTFYSLTKKAAVLKPLIDEIHALMGKKW